MKCIPVSIDFFEMYAVPPFWWTITSPAAFFALPLKKVRSPNGRSELTNESKRLLAGRAKDSAFLL
jgi:hypothetical protein